MATSIFEIKIWGQNCVPKRTVFANSVTYNYLIIYEFILGYVSTWLCKFIYEIVFLITWLCKLCNKPANYITKYV